MKGSDRLYIMWARATAHSHQTAIRACTFILTIPMVSNLLVIKNSMKSFFIVEVVDVVFVPNVHAVVLCEGGIRNRSKFGDELYHLLDVLEGKNVAHVHSIGAVMAMNREHINPRFWDIDLLTVRTNFDVPGGVLEIFAIKKARIIGSVVGQWLEDTSDLHYNAVYKYELLKLMGRKSHYSLWAPAESRFESTMNVLQRP
jgi:hypothetical protein